MKKLLPALLLIAALTLSLCACGGNPTQTAAPASAKMEAAPADSSAAEAAPEPSPEPEPEKLYVRREKELLVQKTVYGKAPGTGIPAGRAFDAVTDYVYDDFGELISEFTHYEHTSQRNSYYGETELEYGEGGQVIAERRERPSQGLMQHWLYEYDAQGYCIHWRYDFDTIGSAEARFSYDGEGRLSFISLTVNDEGEQTMTPVYENGVQVATKHVAPDGGEVEQRFLYDGQGRLSAVEFDAADRHLAERHLAENFFIVDYPRGEFRYNPYHAGDKHIEILFHYGEDDLITEAEWKENGVTVDRTRYSYPASKNEEGAIAYSVPEGSSGPILWSGTFGDPWDRDSVITTSFGSPSFVRRSDMTILGFRPQYVDSIVDYEYETRNVQVEAEPSEQERAVTLEQLYPALPENCCGVALPQPDGSRQLVRVELANYIPVPLAAEPVYRADGSCAGVITRFDGQAAFQTAFWHEGVQADGQGRLVYDPEWDSSITWAEDGRSFTFSSSGREPSEYLLEKYSIPELVNPDLTMREGWEFNDDGLPSKVVTRYSDGERVREYSYHLETNVRNNRTGEEGCTILTANNGQYDDSVMIFDAHGYLTYYSLPGCPTITYVYE